MYAFTYHRATSVAHAVALAASGEDVRFLAGGQTLVQAMKLRLASPSELVDLSELRALQGISADERGVVIGAMTRHADVAASNLVQQKIPALSALAGMIGDPQVRHMGTAGGSIANSDPAADYPAAVLGLGATIITDRRRIEADAFFTDLYETALAPDELILSIAFPVPQRAAYMKFRNPASRFALVGVFLADFGGAVRVAITGAGPSVFRQAEMEAALIANFAPESVASIEVKANGLNGDLHASPQYRAHLITVMARRAVESLLGGNRALKR